jgi:hypothetical protein
VGLEVFAQYAYRRTLDDNGSAEWFHRFELPRAHMALDAQSGRARGRVVVEAVRSAAEGALIGVAGDSLVMRLREAHAGYRYGPIEASAGVIPTLLIPELEGAWRMRVVAADPREHTGLIAPADLGVRARVLLPGGYGWVGAGAYNGEGYDSRELNRGKNGELAASFRPLPSGLAQHLLVVGAYQVGSTGTGLARANRATGGLFWDDFFIGVGASATYAWGVDDDGSRKSWLVDAFIRSEPVPALLLSIRGSHWVRATESDPQLEGEDTVTWMTASAGYRLEDPLELHTAVGRSLPSDRARGSLPDADHWEARLITRIVF